MQQEACSSPRLFNATMNYLLHDVMNDIVKILSFADDYTMIGDDIDEMQAALNKWVDKLESNGLKISRPKSEYLYCPLACPDAPTPPPLMIGTEMVPICTSSKYLGLIVNQTCECDEDVNHRVSVAWLKWRENSGMLCDKKLPMKLKEKLYSTVMRLTLTYGSKCWSLLDRHKKKMTATEMKMVRISSGITKLDHIKSDQIRGSLHVKEPIVDKLDQERIKWFEEVEEFSQNMF